MFVHACGRCQVLWSIFMAHDLHNLQYERRSNMEQTLNRRDFFKNYAKVEFWNCSPNGRSTYTAHSLPAEMKIYTRGAHQHANIVLNKIYAQVRKCGQVVRATVGCCRIIVSVDDGALRSVCDRRTRARTCDPPSVCVCVCGCVWLCASTKRIYFTYTRMCA